MTSRSTVVSLLAIGLGLPLALHAQQFQEPTPDELKMTADPKAPGAAAIYLDIREITDRDVNYQSYYARIKVLSEKGMELATVELPYQKHVYSVADIQGRTIQPDGSIVKLSGKPAELLNSKGKGYEEGRKVFTLPSVQVGSILEYYYQIRFNNNYVPNPYWEIQHTYPVRKAHYQCIECMDLGIFSVLPTGVNLGKDHLGHWVLDLTDVPPAPSEDWMPPMENLLYKAVFYRKYGDDPAYFWGYQGANWSRSVNAFTDPSPAFRQAVKTLTAPTDSDLEKARKLYDAVQSLENTDFTREKTDAERKQLNLKEIDRAEDVWTQKSGTRTQIALLYLSMLHAAGLTGYAMRVVDRNRDIFVPNYFDFDQLDDTIVFVVVDNKEILLDPGEKMCPFHTVSWRHSSATGVRQTATGTAVATSPRQAYSANSVQRIAELKLDSQGAIEGNARFIMTGQQALYWRQKALENDDGEVKKQFDHWVADMVPDGVETHVDHFISLSDPNTPLGAAVNIRGNAGTATSKRVLVPGFLFETHGTQPFVGQEKRLTPIDMHYGESVSDDVTYMLPPGLAVESTPQPNKIPWEGHAVLIVKSTTGTGEVNITRNFARSFTFATTTDYPALRDFYQKVAAADAQQLVLTRSEPAKGN